MKNVAIIGSTGSIGTQTLEIVRVQEDLNIVALAAGSNIELLENRRGSFRLRLLEYGAKRMLRDSESALRTLT